MVGANNAEQRHLNTLAVTSLVLALVGPATMGLGCVAALACGVIALRQIADRDERGSGIAWAGIAIGGAVLVFLIVVALEWTMFGGLVDP